MPRIGISAPRWLDLFGGPPRGSFLDQAKNEHGEGKQVKQNSLFANIYKRNFLNILLFYQYIFRCRNKKKTSDTGSLFSLFCLQTTDITA